MSQPDYSQDYSVVKQEKLGIAVQFKTEDDARCARSSLLLSGVVLPDDIGPENKSNPLYLSIIGMQADQFAQIYAKGKSLLQQFRAYAATQLCPLDVPKPRYTSKNTWVVGFRQTVDKSYAMLRGQMNEHGMAVESKTVPRTSSKGAVTELRFLQIEVKVGEDNLARLEELLKERASQVKVDASPSAVESLMDRLKRMAGPSKEGGRG